MKKSACYFLLTLLVSCFISSCQKDYPPTGSLYIPAESDTTSMATLLELQSGRALYINNCGACHGLHSPDNYSPSDWQIILNSMAPRTGMSQAETNLVLKYVTRGKN